MADPLFLQGYALIEYPTLDEAKAAVESANDEELLDHTLKVDFAFVRPPPTKGQSGGRGARKGARQRSRSPEDVKPEDDGGKTGDAE